MGRLCIALLSVSLCIALLAGMTDTASAQATLRAKVVVTGVPDKFKSANAGESTYGIKNVGVGARVVLKPFASWGTGSYSDSLVAVTSATWSVTGPKGAVTITDTSASATDGLVVYFKPDTSGVFTVNLTANTARGSANATATITAGTFLGTGISLSESSTPSTCSACHGNTGDVRTVFTEWQKTGHATAVKDRLSEAGGHYRVSCMSCHSAGSNTSATAVNGGWDDLAAQDTTYAQWFYPTTPNGPGVYDSLVAKYPALMKLAGVQCESCHGPFGLHKDTFDKSMMTGSMSSEMCAPCHFSSDRHPKGYSWDASGHASSFDEGVVYQYMNRSGCSQCHTGNGFVDYFIDGGTAGTYADPAGVSCQACHDPHNNTNIYQLRRASVADACTACHTNRISSRGLHHSNQGPMIDGTFADAFGPDVPSGTVVGNYSGWELPGYVYENSSHEEIEDKCAACHMAQTPTYNPSYPSGYVDTLLNKVGGHTFAVVWDADTPDDESDDLLNDVGCRSCHGQVSIDFVHFTKEKTQVLLDTLAKYLPQTAGAPKNHTAAGLTTIQKAGAYNYYFVLNDGSGGVHNFKYAEGLLKSSIEQLKLGAGAASITSIKDIPNDQGNRVQVVWNMFPAESYSYGKVVNYGVWRQDLVVGTAASATSYTEMLKTASAGSTVSVAGYVWTFLATVPATGLSQYAYVAPTLADSGASGTNKTLFFIAGYSSDNAVVYQSQPDTGYSVDNIAPLAPTGFQVAYTPSGVDLKWKMVDDPANADVVEYKVHRSTTADFVPGPSNLIATVRTPAYVDNSVTFGVDYYYKVNAVDKSGNPGLFTQVVVVSVEETGGVPTEFALNQNYPNPFNPSTEIRFAVAKESGVRLSVYSLSGELIATVVNGTLSAGNYRVTWSGTTDAGTAVSSGVYLYRLQAGDFVSTRKMVLLK